MFTMHAFGFLGVETHLWWFGFFNHVNLIIKCNLFTLCMFVLRSDWFNTPFTQFHIYSPFTQRTCILRDTMFVCLLGLSFHLRTVPSFWNVSITGEGLFLTYARHSWPWRSEGLVTCHTYCDTGQTFIMVIFEDPWRSHLLPIIW